MPEDRIPVLSTEKATLQEHSISTDNSRATEDDGGEEESPYTQ